MPRQKLIPYSVALLLVASKKVSLFFVVSAQSLIAHLGHSNCRQASPTRLASGLRPPSPSATLPCCARGLPFPATGTAQPTTLLPSETIKTNFESTPITLAIQQSWRPRAIHKACVLVERPMLPHISVTEAIIWTIRAAR